MREPRFSDFFQSVASRDASWSGPFGSTHRILVGIQRSALVFSSLLLSSVASAGTLTAVIPDHFTHAESSVAYRSLGSSCSSVSLIRFVLPCNPAFVDSADEKLFTAHLFIGNDTSNIRKIEQLINGPHTDQFVEDLFTDTRPISMEASGEFTFRTRYFGAALEPYRVTYFSWVRNASYPVISLHAMHEARLRLMLGGVVANSEVGESSAGVQLRAVKRRFIQTEFTLFDAIATPKDVLPVREQTAVFIEPGLSHVFTDIDWTPRVSVFVANVGWQNQAFEEVDQNPVFDFGTGVRPPIAIGNLDLALSYRLSRSEPRLENGLRGAASYSLGLLEAMASVGNDSWAAGLMTSFWAARVGIVYTGQKVHDPSGFEVTSHTTMTEFGIVF